MCYDVGPKQRTKPWLNNFRGNVAIWPVADLEHNIKNVGMWDIKAHRPETK